MPRWDHIRLEDILQAMALEMSGRSNLIGQFSRLGQRRPSGCNP